MIGSVVLAHYQRSMNTWTDRQTDRTAYQYRTLHSCALVACNKDDFKGKALANFFLKNVNIKDKSAT